MMEADLISMLLASAGVAALVSDRVTPVSRTQGSTLPAITVQRISGAPEYAADGEVGLLNARVQVDCWGSDYGDSKLLAAAVINELSAVRDVIGTAGTKFIFILLENERDFRETGANDAEYLNHTALDFMIWTDF